MSSDNLSKRQLNSASRVQRTQSVASNIQINRIKQRVGQNTHT